MNSMDSHFCLANNLRLFHWSAAQSRHNGKRIRCSFAQTRDILEACCVQFQSHLAGAAAAAAVCVGGGAVHDTIIQRLDVCAEEYENFLLFRCLRRSP